MAATIARDFRETYGLKIVPPFVSHVAAVASLTLLRSMQQPLSPSPTKSTTEIEEIEEIERSFAECFRCLLGTGLQDMHARSVARMVYCTSVEMGIKLPDSVQQIISLVVETAWQPLDLHQLSSTYPNWATVDRNESPNMEDVLQKWEDMTI
ncbi:hypothetical protein PRZ48_000010 [Zasmidium cellare]|uniref:Uncharacterized protein n=1 Tax=Zasmidium cellare TaxID=395010 RepID=A0ABR0EYY6_ZASCE|nr:hypothetical protein PRZ48_000010 [Zasmidium cellare]